MPHQRHILTRSKPFVISYNIYCCQIGPCSPGEQYSYKLHKSINSLPMSVCFIWFSHHCFVLFCIILLLFLVVFIIVFFVLLFKLFQFVCVFVISILYIKLHLTQLYHDVLYLVCLHSFFNHI